LKGHVFPVRDLKFEINTNRFAGKETLQAKSGPASERAMLYVYGQSLASPGTHGA
jgi:hypothetical protein